MADTTEILRLGAICYIEGDIIGQGSYGTIVYRGTFENRNVAVKKIPEHNAKIAERERSLLLQIDPHPNIVRYFHMEKDHNGYHIVLTLCNYTLEDYVNGKFDDQNLDSDMLLKDITKGVRFLHENNIIHHDLKPGNILITYPNYMMERRAMIGDFGISKHIKGTKEDITLTSKKGTEGYVAPEVYTSQIVAKASDIFPLGCIFFYVVSNGEKLFESERDLQEEFYEMCIQSLDTEGCKKHRSLILKMISREPTLRPSCEQILFHHIFWNNEKAMKFIQDCSDYLTNHETERVEFDKKPQDIFEDDWLKVLSDNLIFQLVNGTGQGKEKMIEMSREEIRNVFDKNYDTTRLSSLLQALSAIIIGCDVIIDKSRQQLILTALPGLLSLLYDTAETWEGNKYMENFYNNSIVSIDDVTYHLDSWIRNASNGSAIIKGQYQHRNVAIKRYPSKVSCLGENQWKILSEIRHPNVVTLYRKIDKINFVYIVEKLGQYNLFEYVENGWNCDNPSPTRLLKHITTGLLFLQARKIIHCNLTPSNILISYPNQLSMRRAMISDFELSQEYHKESSISWNQAVAKVSWKWLAPELRKAETGNFTKSCDIFSLGCIYLYVISNGCHIGFPFSDSQTDGLCNTEIGGMDFLSGYTSVFIRQMLNLDPKLRRIDKNFYQYPLFWPTQKRSAFGKAVLDFIQISDKAENVLLSTAGEVLARNWILQFDRNLVRDLVRDRSNSDLYAESRTHAKELFDHNSISSIINVMRTIENNVEILSKNTNIFGPSPDGCVKYFFEFFPNIADFMYDAMWAFKDHRLLRKFYSRETALESDWDRVELEIFRAVMSKLPAKCLSKVECLSTTWKALNSESFFDGVHLSRQRWTRTSFANAMKTSPNFKEICVKSSEEWRRKTSPSLLLTTDITEEIIHISMSNDGQLLAVACEDSLQIYTATNFAIKFSRDTNFYLSSSSINAANSKILGNTNAEMIIMVIADGLPIVCRAVSHEDGISEPWLTVDIFISLKLESGMTSFWLNKISESRNRNISEIQRLEICQAKGRIIPWKIFTSEDSYILVYRAPQFRLVVKIFAKEDMHAAEMTFTSDSSAKQYTLPSQDQEFTVRERVKDYAPAYGTKNMVIYVLVADGQHWQTDFRFICLDLVNSQVKSSIFLVPDYFENYKTLHANERYVISGSTSKCVYVWDVKSGVCIAELAHEKEILLSVVHPNNSQLVITACCVGKQLNLWQLNS